MNPFVERHQDQIAGVLTCWDRVIITGTLPEICHAEALARYLSQRDIRLFDYPRWAEPFRHRLRAHAVQVAEEAGLEIEFIRRHDGFRKEAVSFRQACMTPGSGAAILTIWIRRWRIANGPKSFTSGCARAERSAAPLCQLAQYGA